MKRKAEAVNQHTHVAVYTEALARALERRGIDPAPVFAAAGVERTRSLDPMLRIPDAAVNVIYAHALRLTGDEYFGLEVADFIPPSMLHALGYALLASDTLEDLWRRLQRFLAVVSQNPRAAIEQRGEALSLSVELRRADLCFETHDTFLALVMRVMREACNEDIRASRVELMRPAPAGGIAPFVACAGCEPGFDAPALVLEFPLELMRRPLPGASPDLALHHDSIVTEYLARLDRDDILSRVRAEIVAGLACDSFGRAEVAARLHMSPSTLQARLARRGTSFQAVLEETRRELAIGFIVQQRRSVTEVAFLLGFSDISNFNRAFRRWTGMAPTEYRDNATR